MPSSKVNSFFFQFARKRFHVGTFLIGTEIFSQLLALTFQLIIRSLLLVHMQPINVYCCHSLIKWEFTATANCVCVAKCMFTFSQIQKWLKRSVSNYPCPLNASSLQESTIIRQGFLRYLNSDVIWSQNFLSSWICVIYLPANVFYLKSTSAIKINFYIYVQSRLFRQCSMENGDTIDGFCGSRPGCAPPRVQLLQLHVIYLRGGYQISGWSSL